IGTLIDLSIDQLGGEENEHGTHLLPLSIDDIIGDPIEQDDLGRHGAEEFFLKKFHLLLYGLPDLRNYFYQLVCRVWFSEPKSRKNAREGGCMGKVLGRRDKIGACLGARETLKACWPIVRRRHRCPCPGTGAP